MDPHRYNHHSMFLRKDNADLKISRLSVAAFHFISWLNFLYHSDLLIFTEVEELTEEDVGLLVQLGFDITAFTPTAYQRGSLPRPS